MTIKKSSERRLYTLAGGITTLTMGGTFAAFGLAHPGTIGHLLAQAPLFIQGCMVMGVAGGGLICFVLSYAMLSATNY